MSSVTLRGTTSPVLVPKIICVGRNYAAHAKEMKADLPEQPVLFLKPPSAVLRDGGTILLPKISKDLHHEVEMTVLIGTGGKNIDERSALRHVAGYGIGLDMTLRDVQSEAKKKGLPWTLAKGFDTSAPLSDFVPASQVPDPYSLTVELRVNGTVRQSGSTSSFIFRLEHLIAYISTFFTLEAGDILFTGTPEGVAQTSPGDTLEAVLKTSDGASLASLTARVAAA